MSKLFFQILSSILVIAACYTSCKTTSQRRGYVNDQGIWVDTVHFTIRDTVIKHVTVAETFENVPYFSVAKPGKKPYLPSAPTSWVNDYSKVLKPAQKKSLDSLIQNH